MRAVFVLSVLLTIIFLVSCEITTDNIYPIDVGFGHDFPLAPEPFHNEELDKLVSLTVQQMVLQHDDILLAESEVIRAIYRNDSPYALSASHIPHLDFFDGDSWRNVPFIFPLPDTLRIVSPRSLGGLLPNAPLDWNVSVSLALFDVEYFPPGLYRLRADVRQEGVRGMENILRYSHTVVAEFELAGTIVLPPFWPVEYGGVCPPERPLAGMYGRLRRFAHSDELDGLVSISLQSDAVSIGGADRIRAELVNDSQFHIMAQRPRLEFFDGRCWRNVPHPLDWSGAGSFTVFSGGSWPATVMLDSFDVGYFEPGLYRLRVDVDLAVGMGRSAPHTVVAEFWME